jgi:hypothetical protein
MGRGWHKWQKYETEKQRDQALEVLNKKDNLFEYSISKTP